MPLHLTSVSHLLIKKHFNFSQIFRLFSKPSMVFVNKALDEKFTYTAENQKLIK